MWSLCPLYEEAEFGCGEKQTSPNGVSTLSSLKVVTPRAMTRGQPPGSGEGVTGICEWQIEGRLCCAYSHSHTVSRELLWHLASLLQPDQCIQALALRSTCLILPVFISSLAFWHHSPGAEKNDSLREIRANVWEVRWEVSPEKEKEKKNLQGFF